MTLDKVARNAAVKLISQFGKGVTLVSLAPAGYNTATGKTTPTPTSQITKGVVTKYNSHNLPNSNVIAGDEKILVAAALVTVEPKSGDNITTSSGTFSVVNVETTWSGELPALYEIAGRKA